jgi:hypothetical protein
MVLSSYTDPLGNKWKHTAKIQALPEQNRATTSLLKCKTRPPSIFIFDHPFILQATCRLMRKPGGLNEAVPVSIK